MIDFGLWEKLSEENIAGMIYAGAKGLDELNPSHEIIRLLGNQNESRSVLDFGCGVGRNLIGMATTAPKWRVVGYDNTMMVRIASQYIFGKIPDDSDVSIIGGDWSRIVRLSKGQPFDMIFCCCVLQHISETQLRWYLDQFKEIGKELFVFGRRAIDQTNTGAGYDGRNNFKSVWKIILDCGYEISEAQEGFAIEGNGNDHHWVRFKNETTRRIDADT